MENMVMGTTPMSPTPVATGRIISKEALLQVGLASFGVGVGSSQALVQAGHLHAWGDPVLWWADRWDLTSILFTLDDATEMEQESIDVGVASALEALNNAVGVLRDVVTPASWVLCDPNPWVSSLSFHVSNSLFPL
jgi:hypothetical protein